MVAEPTRRHCFLDTSAKKNVLGVYLNIVNESGEKGAHRKVAVLTNVVYNTIWWLVHMKFAKDRNERTNDLSKIRDYICASYAIKERELNNLKDQTET